MSCHYLQRNISFGIYLGRYHWKEFESFNQRDHGTLEMVGFVFKGVELDISLWAKQHGLTLAWSTYTMYVSTKIYIHTHL